jgi:uncharacterized protein YndB with AHSA1/START domain
MWKLAVATVILASRAAADVPLVEKPGHITSAVVTVDAPPHAIYEEVTDYAHWPQFLTDVTSANVEGGGRRDAKVRFRSKALGHEVAVKFDNEPDHVIRFTSVDAPPGAHARGEYVLEPIDGGKRTRLTATLYLDVGGPGGWFIDVRARRRAKVAADLAAGVAWFASHHE